MKVGIDDVVIPSEVEESVFSGSSERLTGRFLNCASGKVFFQDQLP